jgi:hypothetical protein
LKLFEQFCISTAIPGLCLPRCLDMRDSDSSVRVTISHRCASLELLSPSRRSAIMKWSERALFNIDFDFKSCASACRDM